MSCERYYTMYSRSCCTSCNPTVVPDINPHTLADSVMSSTGCVIEMRTTDMMLGFGDVYIPGWFITICLRYDHVYYPGKWFRPYYITSSIGKEMFCSFFPSGIGCVCFCLFV